MKNPVHQNRRALSATEIAEQLHQLNGEQSPSWRVANGALEKTFAFDTYGDTMSFVNAIAFIARHEDHHPDLAVSYGHCTVRWSTHDVQGISVSDFFCASKVDALLL
ncbi:MAG: 4a-hydroxytetrahydrobiopterin dehydratase [Polaromonas sp.]